MRNDHATPLPFGRWNSLSTALNNFGSCIECTFANPSPRFCLMGRGCTQAILGKHSTRKLKSVKGDSRNVLLLLLLLLLGSLGHNIKVCCFPRQLKIVIQM